jgi:hypothetical protein
MRWCASCGGAGCSRCTLSLSLWARARSPVGWAGAVGSASAYGITNEEPGEDTDAPSGSWTHAERRGVPRSRAADGGANLAWRRAARAHSAVDGNGAAAVAGAGTNERVLARGPLRKHANRARRRLRFGTSITGDARARRALSVRAPQAAPTGERLGQDEPARAQRRARAHLAFVTCGADSAHRRLWATSSLTVRGAASGAASVGRRRATAGR